MNPHDAFFQKLVPTVMMPAQEELPPLEEAGHRFLAASDGLWVEIRRPWLHLIWPVAQQTAVAMPYGSLNRKCEIAGGPVPALLLEQFVRAACETPHTECAAWLVWDELQQVYRCQMVDVISAGSHHIHYNRPVLQEHEHLVVDMHSHAGIPAFFSPEDNEDDAGEVKFSFVVGNCGDQSQSRVMRLCALGLLIDIPLGQQ